MKPVIWLPSSCALILILTGCATNKPTAETGGPGYGPFDKQGTYHEEWADDPSKWSKPSKRHQEPLPSDELPIVTKNEQPPANANPLAPQIASNSKPTPKKVESMPRETTPRESTKHESTRHETVKHSAEPKEMVSKTKSTPVKAKPKSKPKPKSTRYVVKKGDSLSTIAHRNGSSVSAIQNANDISGTLIHPGQSLVIPKH